MQVFHEKEMDEMSKRLFMPAEWEAHERTFISWPVKESMVYPEDYEKVVAGYSEIIEAIAEFEPVTILAVPDEQEQVRARFQHEQVDVVAIDHNDAWLRDNGPTFVRDEHRNVLAVNWKFNAWGEKYTPYDLDEQVAARLIDHFQLEKIDVPLVMEGGSFHVDGQGTLLTTEECLLNENRNPHLNKEEIERFVKDVLGIEKVIWLKRAYAVMKLTAILIISLALHLPGK